jgi:hypothetical protein
MMMADCMQDAIIGPQVPLGSSLCEQHGVAVNIAGGGFHSCICCCVAQSISHHTSRLVAGDEVVHCCSCKEYMARIVARAHDRTNARPRRYALFACCRMALPPTMAALQMA